MNKKYNMGFTLRFKIQKNKYFSNLIANHIKSIFLFFVVITASFLINISNIYSESSLSIETDYRLRGISYTNNDFDTETSTDTLSYYSQRLQLSLVGHFNGNIEIGSKITAVGVVGSTSSIFNVPYTSTDFTPYVQNAYIKIKNFADLPIDLIIGKQPLTYGQGLIICDNEIGFNAFRIIGRYELKVPFLNILLPCSAEFFTAKIKDNFKSSSDQDLYGAVFNTSIDKSLFEIAYFKEQDYTGTKYSQGENNEYITKDIVKNYYDFRLERKEKISSIYFEIAKQTGYIINQSSDTSISLDGLGFVLYGQLIGEKTKLGKVAAHASIAYFSGDSNPLSYDNDKSFSPTFTKKYDGLERIGYGELFAASPAGSALFVPESYSGIDTLNLGVEFMPLYAWTLGMDYFLYAASESLLTGVPSASGFERLYGAEYALGVEMDLFVKYEYSKYTNLRFSYNRYTPPKYEVFWPKNDPATRYQLEFIARF